MKIKSKIRAGEHLPNHNQTRVQAKGIRIKSGVRAGDPGGSLNHNQMRR